MTTESTNGAPGESTAARILEAWIRLENVLRSALPVCSVHPPTQPTELLSALRINHRIGPEEETRVLALRKVRNLAAHNPEEPSAEEAHRFEEETMALVATIMKNKEESC